MLQTPSQTHYGFQKCWTLTSLKLQIFRSSGAVNRRLDLLRVLFVAREIVRSSRIRSCSAEGETAGVEVHLGEAEVLERCGQGEGGLERHVTQQVTLLTPLLKLERRVIQHLPMSIAHTLHLQPVQLTTQTDQLTRQPLVLQLHLPLTHTHTRRGKLCYILVNATKFINVYKRKSIIYC